jgi:hypothetical protein
VKKISDVLAQAEKRLAHERIPNGTYFLEFKSTTINHIQKLVTI